MPQYSQGHSVCQDNVAKGLTCRWNFGKTDAILDDQEAIFRLAGILDDPVAEEPVWSTFGLSASFCFLLVPPLSSLLSRLTASWKSLSARAASLRSRGLRRVPWNAATASAMSVGQEPSPVCDIESACLFVDTLSTFSWETLFDHFTCMQRDCSLAILGPLVIARTSKEQWHHYCNMLSRAFTAVCDR